MKLRRTVRSFSHCSSLALAAALAVPAVIALPGAAHAQAVRQSFNIPAGDLAAALQAFSAQTGIQLVYSSDLVAGKRSPGVSGEMSAQEALGQLLAGTGLSARVSGNSATLVQVGPSGDVGAAEGERLLGPVRVEGSQSARGPYQAPVRGEGIAQLGGERGKQDEEAVGYRAKVASVSVGGPVALEDIPRSITVLTQNQIKNQDIVTLDDALDRTPGVTTVQSGDGTSSIFIRGFQVDKVQIDGGATRSIDPFGGAGGNGLINLDAYERVEIVRGPNSLASGELSAGGVINLVRKRPLDRPSQSISIEGGSFDRIGAVVDVSEPMLFGSNIGFRAVGSVRRAGSFVDDYSTSTKSIYAILDAPLGDSARFEFGWHHTENDIEGENRGVPRYLGGISFDVPRSRNFSPPGMFQKASTDEWFANLYVDIAEDWDLEINSTFNTSSSRRRGAERFFDFLEDGSLPFGPGFIQISEVEKSSPGTISLAAKVTGTFETFGLTHNVFASVTASQLHQRGRPISRFLGFYNINSLADFDYADFTPAPAENLTQTIYSDEISRNIGLIIGDTISWNDIISLSMVARNDFSAQATHQVISADGGPAEIGTINGQQLPGDGTWRLSYSANIKPTRNLNLFASYADTFHRPLFQYARTGTAPDYVYTLIAPATIRNFEVGAKWASRDWQASLSYFDMKWKGVARPDGSFECPPSVDDSGNYTGACFLADGESGTSKGVDFELTGQLAPGLSAIASYNYNKTKVESSTFLGNPAVLPLQTLAPQSSANLLLDWTPSFLPSLSLRLGGRYKGKYFAQGLEYIFDSQGVFQGVNDYTIRQKAYAIFDAGVEYRASNNLKIRVNIDNITDKKYFSTLNFFTSGGTFYGAPRTVLLSLDWKQIGDRKTVADAAPFGNASDWYVAFDAGLSLTGSFDGQAKGKAQDGTSDVVWRHEVNKSPSYSARIGYHLAPQLRVEFEGSYKTSSFGDIDGNAVAPFGLCGSLGASSGLPFTCNNVGGQFDRLSGKINLAYDFADADARVAPFVGAGVGLTRTSLAYEGKMEGIGPDASWQLGEAVPMEQQRLVGIDTSIDPSAQIFAGLSYRVSPSLRVEAMWRHELTKAVRWSTFNLDRPSPAASPLTGRLGDFKADIHTNTFSLGIRWNFGRR